jgi:hypothetical protein
MEKDDCPPASKEHYHGDDGKHLTAVSTWNKEELIFDCVFSPAKRSIGFKTISSV